MFILKSTMVHIFYCERLGRRLKGPGDVGEGGQERKGKSNIRRGGGEDKGRPGDERGEMGSGGGGQERDAAGLR